MLCMICKQNVPDEAVICPTCGAMPWKMPESFLNPEQHQVWLDTIYTPQLERWERVLRLQEEVSTLQAENSRLQNETHSQQRTIKASEKKIKELEQKLKAAKTPAAPQKPKPKAAKAPAAPQEQGLTVSTNEFEIRNGVLIRYRGNASEVVIPEGVTSIGEHAFEMCFSLHSITLPDGLKSIGKCAFSSCINISSIIIPSTVTRIDHNAFLFCVNLKYAEVPETTKMPAGCFPSTCRIIRY